MQKLRLESGDRFFGKKTRKKSSNYFLLKLNFYQASQVGFFVSSYQNCYLNLLANIQLSFLDQSSILF